MCCLPEVGVDAVVGGALTVLEARGLPRRQVVVEPDEAVAVGRALHGATWLLTDTRHARRHGLAWTPFEGEPIRHRLVLRWAGTPGAARVAAAPLGVRIADTAALLLGIDAPDSPPGVPSEVAPPALPRDWGLFPR